MYKKLKKFGRVTENANLKEYNTFKIGGTVKYLVEPDNSVDLRELIEYLNRKEIKYMIIGNGSNIIFSDNEYDGVLIKLSEMNTIEIYPAIQTAFVEAGAMLPKVAAECLEEGLSGFEWASGIPGTIGGAIVGNAGAYLSCTFDRLKNVTVIDPDGNFRKIKKEDISYGYRTSMFKERKKWIILVAEFALESCNRDEIKSQMAERAKRRIEEQPLDMPTAGSVFRNPNPKEIEDIIKKHKLKQTHAGYLIEKVGLKGKKIGGAEISTKHANFIVNTGDATAQDVKSLIELAHDEVYNKYGIDLIMEQEFIGWE